MKKYTALEIVGEGTFGTVAKCANKTTGQIVAVKRLRAPVYDSVHCEFIVRELNILRLLNNDHIVSMIEVFRHHGYVYMVLPFMDSNLFTHLEQKGGTLNVKKTREYMYQVLKGLSYVHSQNIVHRDIKPENILLSSTGIIKICDFGVSRLFCPNQSLDLSADVGTLWYQAPEMLMRSKTYNTTVDIWSVGILFTELVGGWPLVTKEKTIDQLFSIIETLDCGINELALFNRHLINHGIIFNTKNRQSKSYVLSNTTFVLQKKYDRWPTNLVEIVAYCLQLNPVNRKNATQLLDMDFFTNETFLLLYNKQLKINLMNENTMKKYEKV